MTKTPVAYPKQPTQFQANNGKRFQVRVRKSTIRCWWLELYDSDNTYENTIKVRKTSPKLVYGLSS